MYVCVYDLYPWCLWRLEKIVGALELELQVFVSYHVGARD